MTVPVQVPFTASTANGVTTSFPYDFKIASADDLVVEVDGVVVTTGFSITGVGVLTGGNVLFVTPPDNGSKVVRYRKPIMKRTTDYQQFGDWNADTVNPDFDALWLVAQYLEHAYGRAIKLPVDTADDQVITEDATDRALKGVGFDALGKLKLYALASGAALVDLAASTGSSLIGWIQSGAGMASRTVESKLRDYEISIKDAHPLVGTGDVNIDTAAFIAVTSALRVRGGGGIFFPAQAQRYLINTGVIVGTAAGWTAESSFTMRGDGCGASVIEWRGGGNGSTGTFVDWRSGVYGGIYDLGMTTNCATGHTSQTIDGFVTTTTGNGGCTAVSSVCIKHAYNGTFAIRGCDIQKFHIGIWMDLGYNRAVTDSAISWCNVGLGTYGAATINDYRNLRIERNAIGMSFAVSSAMTIDTVVSEANYAGCDVLIGTFCHSLDFNKLYCEASPKQVYMLGGGGVTLGTGLSSGIRFRNCNSLSIEAASNVGDITVEDSIMMATPITQNAGQGSYYIKNLWQHSAGSRVAASGYSVSAPAFVYELNQRDCINGSWTPLATSLTVVGTPTYSGTYERIGKTVHCTLRVSSTTTTAATANVTYFTGLPFTPSVNSVCVAANPNTIADYGNGIVSTAGRVYVPTWPAVNAVEVSFSYRI